MLGLGERNVAASALHDRVDLGLRERRLRQGLVLPGNTAGLADQCLHEGILAVARLRLLGRLALGRWLHGTAGLDGGVAVRGVEATDAGVVVTSARGATMGATLGLEAP